VLLVPILLILVPVIAWQAAGAAAATDRGPSATVVAPPPAVRTPAPSGEVVEGPSEGGPREAAAAEAHTPTAADEFRGVRQSWAALILLPLGLAFLAAPVGATILGIMAISHIRNSGGRIYGLGLALFDALLYPLLALDGFLIITMSRFVGLKAILGLAPALAADILIVWLAWRVFRRPARRQPAPQASASQA